MDRNERDEAYRQRINEVYSELQVRTIAGREENNGQNNDVVVVNETLIFRFPRYQRGVKELEAEVGILRGLQGRLPLPIPDPMYVSVETHAVGQTFMGYERLPGEPLYQDVLERLGNEAVVPRVAAQLGAFLRELHAIPTEDFTVPLPVANDRGTWESLYARIEESLFPHMRLDAREQVAAHFEAFLDEPRHFAFAPVLIHGDFGPSNILYDVSTRSVSGVIDWASAGLGDPATDLAALIGPVSYGEAFGRHLSKTYPDVENLLERAHFYVGTFALQEALFGVEEGDTEAFAAGIAEYR